MPALAELVASPLAPFGGRLDGAGAPATDLEPAWLLELARREKVLLLRGFRPLERDAFLAWCRSFPGPGLLEWSFGPVMEMREDPRAANYLFSREAVPFHWDGAFHRVPSFLMFTCVEAPVDGGGGQTLFCDTTRLWAEADADERRRLSSVTLTYETRKLAHYGGKITGPLAQRHPATGEEILRFAEPVETVLNPVAMSAEGLPEPELSGLLARLSRRLYEPEFCLEHQWEPGDMLIADNHALVHGRRAFAKDCPRHLRRIQLL